MSAPVPEYMGLLFCVEDEREVQPLNELSAAIIAETALVPQAMTLPSSDTDNWP